MVIADSHHTRKANGNQGCQNVVTGDRKAEEVGETH